MISIAYALSPESLLTFESAPITGPSSSVISFGYIIQLIFSLIIVLGFIYVASKYLLPRLATGTKGRILEVTDKVVLEPQVTSYILKAGKASYLIVVSNKTAVKIDRLEGESENI